MLVLGSTTGDGLRDALDPKLQVRCRTGTEGTNGSRSPEAERDDAVELRIAGIAALGIAVLLALALVPPPTPGLVGG